MAKDPFFSAPHPITVTSVPVGTGLAGLPAGRAEEMSFHAVGDGYAGPWPAGGTPEHGSRGAGMAPCGGAAGPPEPARSLFRPAMGMVGMASEAGALSLMRATSLFIKLGGSGLGGGAGRPSSPCAKSGCTSVCIAWRFS